MVFSFFFGLVGSVSFCLGCVAVDVTVAATEANGADMLLLLLLEWLSSISKLVLLADAAALVLLALSPLL
jgi:hypothetical protein